MRPCILHSILVTFADCTTWVVSDADCIELCIWAYPGLHCIPWTLETCPKTVSVHLSDGLCWLSQSDSRLDRGTCTKLFRSRRRIKVFWLLKLCNIMPDTCLALDEMVLMCWSKVRFADIHTPRSLMCFLKGMGSPLYARYALSGMLYLLHEKFGNGNRISKKVSYLNLNISL